MTILPRALSPHSLASVPAVGDDDGSFAPASFTFSVPRNSSVASALGGRSATDADAADDDEDGGQQYSESEISESEGERSRDASQHGPLRPLLPPPQLQPTQAQAQPPSGWQPARQASGGGGGGKQRQ